MTGAPEGQPRRPGIGGAALAAVATRPWLSDALGAAAQGQPGVFAALPVREGVLLAPLGPTASGLLAAALAVALAACGLAVGRPMPVRRVGGGAPTGRRGCPAPRARHGRTPPPFDRRRPDPIRLPLLAALRRVRGRGMADASADPPVAGVDRTGAGAKQRVESERGAGLERVTGQPAALGVAARGAGRG